MSKSKKSIFKRWWFWLIVIIIIGGIVGQTGGKKDTKDPDSEGTKQEVSKNENKKEETKITYENFLAIKLGEPYSEVVKLLGEGKEDTSSEVAGIKTAIYSWKGEGLSNMNVTVQNDVVTGKAQLGLKAERTNITLEKYNSIKEGMTYDEVKGILGEGEVLSESKIMDSQSIIYSYSNKDGSNANFTFNGNKLQVKSQFQLK